jgi:hypothetical protein
MMMMMLLCTSLDALNYSPFVFNPSSHSSPYLSLSLSLFLSQTQKEIIKGHQAIERK